MSECSVCGLYQLPTMIVIEKQTRKSHAATDTIHDSHNDQTYHDDSLLQKMNREKIDLMNSTQSWCYHREDWTLTEKNCLKTFFFLKNHVFIYRIFRTSWKEISFEIVRVFSVKSWKTNGQLKLFRRRIEKTFVKLELKFVDGKCSVMQL